jgi:hypothetical protein
MKGFVGLMPENVHHMGSARVLQINVVCDNFTFWTASHIVDPGAAALQSLVMHYDSVLQSFAQPNSAKTCNSASQFCMQSDAKADASNMHTPLVTESASSKKARPPTWQLASAKP